MYVINLLASTLLSLVIIISSLISDDNLVNCVEIGIVNLKESISELEDYVKNLTIQLHQTELRLSRVEDDCKCINSNYKSENQIKLQLEVEREREREERKGERENCLLSNGSSVVHSSKWISNCSNCFCDHGVINCSPMKCDSPVNCKASSLYFASATDCCPICHKKCLKDGKYIEHNDVYVKDCVKCVCYEGSLRCKRLNPLSYCPRLECPVEKQFKADGECCKYCVDTDFCGNGHDCHSNANCINLKTGFTCKCADGYWGDGRLCSDINECNSLGGMGGNLCRDNTKCVNTNGSYYCQCLPGFRRRDSLNCLDIDECATNEHKCNENSKCINTHGNYSCLCLHGFTGDGFNCQPICNKKCANGGKCIGPDKCLCKRGFHGKYCEKDIDECSLNLHECPSNSKCINKPGWYYCQCLDGYTSYIDKSDSNHDQLKCVDLNECNTRVDTCNEERICVNTEGGYECQCPSSSSSSSPSSSSSSSLDSSCSRDCVVNGLRRLHGSKWDSEFDSCFQCSCSFGVTNCSKRQCNCNSTTTTTNDSIDFNCCPECKKSIDCVDQLDETIKYKNGQTWLSKCKSCQCLFGESKCRDIDCPPIKCSNPIKSADDCCPYCGDDPCGDYIDGLDNHNSFDNLIKPGISINSSLSSGCMYLGKLYANDQQIVIGKDPCANCKCKNGRLCCTYNTRCIANLSTSSTNLNTINSIDSN
ncbi:protein kinase C-binding protein NELL2-like isoform X2 [Panonychus citri]|uniref:protein kinase C-binding protein NELL2-like isoform X2 n=1 Tax=Panonychus citri TaxID=50023 RepID=UPI002307835A|nr:protein kinase C-binding protein NELL2-like isoform X2 [Panonychus citri]